MFNFIKIFKDLLKKKNLMKLLNYLNKNYFKNYEVFSYTILKILKLIFVILIIEINDFLIKLLGDVFEALSKFFLILFSKL